LKKKTLDLRDDPIKLILRKMKLERDIIDQRYNNIIEIEKKYGKDAAKEVLRLMVGINEK